MSFLPPLGAIAAFTPHMAVGFLFPGSGLFGNLLIIIAVAVIPVLPGSIKGAVVMALIGLSAAATFMAQDRKPPEGWEAVQSSFTDRPSDALRARQSRAQWLLDDATQRLMSGAKLILYPETILGERQPGLKPQLQLLSARAKRFDAFVIVGLSVQTATGLENTLVILGKDEGVYRARQPVPLAMWGAWRSKRYGAHWNEGGIHILHGKTTAFLLCWEEWTPWAMARSAVRGPTVILSASNHGWSSRGQSMWERQTLSAEALSRQYSLPILRAVNLPD